VNKHIERERQQKKAFAWRHDGCGRGGSGVCIRFQRLNGVPTLSPFTKKDFEEFQDVQSRLFWAAGMKTQRPLCSCPQFHIICGRSGRYIGAQNLGALCIWAGAIPSDRLLFILKEFQPTVIWTTPSYAWYLGKLRKNRELTLQRTFPSTKSLWQESRRLY